MTTRLLHSFQPHISRFRIQKTNPLGLFPGSVDNPDHDPHPDITNTSRVWKGKRFRSSSQAHVALPSKSPWLPFTIMFPDVNVSVMEHYHVQQRHCHPVIGHCIHCGDLDCIHFCDSKENRFKMVSSKSFLVMHPSFFLCYFVEPEGLGL
jgi:hypothetical protein